MMKRTLMLLLLAGIAGIAAGCGETKTEPAASSEVLRDVSLFQVKTSAIPDYVEAVGTVRAQQGSQLSAQVIATVVSIPVHEGQRVARGQVLAVLDDAQQRAGTARAVAAINAAKQEIVAANADYTLATATRKRYQELYEKKSVSPHEMDVVESSYQAAAAHRDQATAGLAQAEAVQAQASAGLSYTRIRAPFDGVVTAKYVDPGALASPGVPLLAIEDTRHFRLEATVDERNIRFAKLGDAAPVTIDALGRELDGKVVEVVPAADPSSRTFIVKVELPAAPDMRSGLFGRVRFVRGERQGIFIPRSAVVDRGQLQGVYVVGENGSLSLRYVTLGQPLRDSVEVLSGLMTGDKLVADPGDRDLGGKRIEARL